MTVKLRAAVAAASLAAAAHAGGVHAAYPEQTIKIVVPFTPGGATDAVARLLANKLSGKFGQAVIVENRPGASTVIGAEAAARAQPDGYTLMLSGSTTYTVLPALKPGLPYDPQKSYEHIAIVAMAPVVLLAKNGLAAGTIQEAAALAKQRSGKDSLMYGTFGAGSAPHLAGEMYAEAAGAKMTPVPYKGSAQLVTAMIGGEVDLGVDTVSSAAPQVRAGKIRALAVTGERRMPQLPDVPTFTEAGMPDVSFVGWYALVAPARTPAPVVDTLSRAVAEIMEDPQVRKSVADLALDPVYLPAPAFKAQIAKELRTFSDVAARAGIALD
ncbi:tripartite tricarboxylate transporter substrate binding protein [Achromobacter sp.]|uniref:Bug family tripartite tricarboxylate transporter substrate binding protein n=1 Tax=Achromobacter sp. TaxID=134375 RepID=UPI002F9265CA